MHLFVLKVSTKKRGASCAWAWDHCAKCLSGEAPCGSAVQAARARCPCPHFVPLPLEFVPPPMDIVPLRTLSTPLRNSIQRRQSTRSPAGQFAIIVIVIRGNKRYSGLRTAVALSTASLIFCVNVIPHKKIWARAGGILYLGSTYTLVNTVPFTQIGIRGLIIVSGQHSPLHLQALSDFELRAFHLHVPASRAGQNG